VDPDFRTIVGVGNDPVYNKTVCFEAFSFPDCDEQQQARIRELGEALDAHRKRRQALFPNLSLTDMYNVLEKLREINAGRGGINDALDAAAPGAMNRAPGFVRQGNDHSRTGADIRPYPTPLRA